MKIRLINNLVEKVSDGDSVLDGVPPNSASTACGLTWNRRRGKYAWMVISEVLKISEVW